VDNQTLRIKMARPDATVLPLLSSNFQGYLNVAPKEGTDPKVLDISNTTRGSGPWYLEDSNDLQRVFKRNPGFGQDKRNVPYLDGFVDIILPEYAAAMAQFRSGAGYTFGQALAEDIVSLKKDLPQLEVRKTDFGTSRARPFFGLLPGSPFADKRVRQAFVYTWDRDLYADVIFNTGKFQEAGLAADTFWETAIQANNWDGWALDGRSKDFGPNAKYLKKDVAEAKKLLEAAGRRTPMTFTAHSPTQLGGQNAYDRMVEVLLGMSEDSGLFKVSERKNPQWAPTWVQDYHQARAEKHEGVAFTQSSLIFDPINEASLWYHRSSGSSKGSDDTINNLIDKARAEFDDQKRREMVRELQRHEADVAFFPRIAGATGFNINWPAIRNVNVWQGGTPSRPHATIFLDPSKPPLNG
jgi:ABC-type transport system substrate-binding protein